MQILAGVAVLTHQRQLTIWCCGRCVAVVAINGNGSAVAVVLADFVQRHVTVDAGCDLTITVGAGGAAASARARQQMVQMVRILYFTGTITSAGGGGFGA
jgi:hypothetical protein